MKKIFFGALLFCFTINLNAQDYNKFFIDFGLGTHEAINPISAGYSTGALSFGQANLGVRYMFNEKFGLRLGFGYNEFKEGKNSLPFRANYYRTSLEGVVNAGNLLRFSSWTKRLNLLVHAGAGLSTLRTISPTDNSGEPIINLILGVTPQYKISRRFSVFLDLSTVFHDYQNFTYNGAPNNGGRQISPSLFNTSIGVNIALGKQKENADFLSDEKTLVNDEFDEIKKRLDSAEKEIADLKTKKTTVGSTNIDKVALVSELDNRYVKKEDLANSKYSDVVTGSNVDFIRKLLDKGYVNVYFDVNKSKIQQGSINAVNYLKQFLMDNPHVSAYLIGYADETGKESANVNLSKKRAKSVFNILVAAGIEPSRLAYAGGGVDRTVTKGARQLARKVTFKIK